MSDIFQSIPVRSGSWEDEEHDRFMSLLIDSCLQKKKFHWVEICKKLGTRTAAQCQIHYFKLKTKLQLTDQQFKVKLIEQFQQDDKNQNASEMKPNMTTSLNYQSSSQKRINLQRTKTENKTQQNETITMNQNVQDFTETDTLQAKAISNVEVHEYNLPEDFIYGFDFVPFMDE